MVVEARRDMCGFGIAFVDGLLDRADCAGLLVVKRMCEGGCGGNRAERET